MLLRPRVAASSSGGAAARAVVKIVSVVPAPVLPVVPEMPAVAVPVVVTPTEEVAQSVDLPKELEGAPDEEVDYEEEEELEAGLDDAQGTEAKDSEPVG